MIPTSQRKRCRMRSLTATSTGASSLQELLDRALVRFVAACTTEASVTQLLALGGIQANSYSLFPSCVQHRLPHARAPRSTTRDLRYKIATWAARRRVKHAHRAEAARPVSQALRNTLRRLGGMHAKSYSTHSHRSCRGKTRMDARRASTANTWCTLVP